MSEDAKKVEQVEKKKKDNKVLNIVFTIVQIVLILICVVISVVVIISPAAYRENGDDFNTNVMLVVTDSMEPTIKTHDMIFGSKVDEKVTKAEEVLDLGTVVTFAVNNQQYGYYLNSHRIVGYSYNDGVEQENKRIYMTNKTDVAWASIKEEGWKFVGYVTRGDKYTMMYRNGVVTNDGGTLKQIAPLYEEKAGQYSQINLKKIDDLNGDLRLFNSHEVEVDGAKINVIDYDSVSSVHDDQRILQASEIKAVWKGGNIKVVGNVIFWLRDQPWHFAVFIVVPLLLLFGYNIYIIIRMVIADKQQKAKEEVMKELQNNQLSEEEIKKKAIEEYLANLEKDKKQEE